MSVDTSAQFNQGNLASDEIPVDHFEHPRAYDPELVAEQELWNLQRELSSAKLALQAEIWDLRAEVQTLRLNALRAANQLDKIVGQILSTNAPSPYDPSC